jgi:hypothetical protein
MKVKKVFLILSLMLSCIIFTPFSSEAEAQSTVITPEVELIYPPPNGTINDRTPMITINFTNPEYIDLDTIRLYIFFQTIDGRVAQFEVAEWDNANINATNMTFVTGGPLTLADGNHTIRFEAASHENYKTIEEWEFTVDTYVPEEEFTIPFTTVLLVITAILVIGVIAFTAYIIYIKRTQDFEFRKFFIIHPEVKRSLVLYIPMAVSVIFVILALFYVTEHPRISPYRIEMVLIIGFFIGFGVFAVSVKMDRRRTDRYERAYSQLLFEMADAMRGGINPAKAIIEISKTDTSILSSFLQAAAKNIKAGRSFDDVLRMLAMPSRSHLIKRYTSLIVDATKIGGQISLVIHRAAMDMDDFIRIRAERRRQMKMQIFTIYLASFVLLTILALLTDFASSISDFNLTVLMNFDLETATLAQETTGMSFTMLRRRYFHLAIVNGIGSGLIIGNLVEGSTKEGLLHSLILAVITTLFFMVAIF